MKARSSHGESREEGIHCFRHETRGAVDTPGLCEGRSGTSLRSGRHARPWGCHAAFRQDCRRRHRDGQSQPSQYPGVSPAGRRAGAGCLRLVRGTARGGEAHGRRPLRERGLRDDSLPRGSARARRHRRRGNRHRGSLACGHELARRAGGQGRLLREAVLPDHRGGTAAGRCDSAARNGLAVRHPATLQSRLRVSRQHDPGRADRRPAHREAVVRFHRRLEAE